MTRHPSRTEDSSAEVQNASEPGAHSTTIAALACCKKVRIRCIEESERVENSSLLDTNSRAAGGSAQTSPQRAPLPSHPVPYSVAIADGIAQFAKSEGERCAFREYVPALHSCGARSVASVQTFHRGPQRACVRHAQASQRCGLLVAYDDACGYVVAE